ALKRTELPQDYYSKFKMLGFLVRINSERMNTERANVFIIESEKLMEDMSRRLGNLNAEFFYNQGIVLTYRGRFDEARENFLIANKKAKEENEANILAKSLHALAQGAYNRKDFHSSLDFLQQLQE